MKILNLGTIFSAITLLFFSGSFVYAEQLESNDPTEAFQTYFEIAPVQSGVPVVVDIPLYEEVLSSERFLVKENETGEFLRWYLNEESDIIKTSLNANTKPSVSNAWALLDNDRDTSVEFPVTGDGAETAQIVLFSSSPVTTSRIDLVLDENVALPNTVSVRYQDENGEKIALAERRLSGGSIRFPEINTSQIVISFSHSQPLRIAELGVIQKNASLEREQSLRFLAQPGLSYEVYYGPDRTVRVALSESGDLRSDEDVLKLSEPVIRDNPSYTQADVDEDGIPNKNDNCVWESNPDQVDENNNGRGDVCDDWDRDGILNIEDNCINLPNRSQRDTDGDDIGDACDEEESRFTEKNPWLPWVGMGTAATVLLVLFAMVANEQRRQKGNTEEVNEGEE